MKNKISLAYLFYALVFLCSFDNDHWLSSWITKHRHYLEMDRVNI